MSGQRILTTALAVSPEGTAPEGTARVGAARVGAARVGAARVGAAPGRESSPAAPAADARSRPGAAPTAHRPGITIGLRTLLLIAALALLAGCASVPPEPPTPLPQPELTQPPKQVNGAIYQSGHDVRLFEDRNARRVGDIITVALEEETDASKEATTSITKDSQVELGVPTVFGRPMTLDDNPISGSLSGNRDFQGEGSSDQSNELSGTVTAIVTDVMPNGNLVIQGQKKMTLNRGDEYVTISGIIRPDDVRPDNTVSSTRIANARISYTGTGAMADANTMGWLSRFFNSVIWPF